LGDSQAIEPKYNITASFEVEGVVEKSDVIGALFGQTEGLFGPELDLHELQKNGRIGRIEIQMDSKKDRTNGKIIVPSSLDKPLAALIAAAIENVDRVGPCTAKVKLEKIEDVREKQRESIIKRAQEILHKWTIEATPTTEQVASQVYKILKRPDVVAYGPEKLSAGPDVDKSSSLILVEGRADVGKLLRSGLRNVIACDGTKIPKTIIKLSKEKEITAFLDGDRGGDMILEELFQVANIAYVARAPRGKEVEDLTPKQILAKLKAKKPVKEVKRKAPPKAVKEVKRKAPPKATSRRRKAAPPKAKKPGVDIPKEVQTLTGELSETLEAVVLDEKMERIEKLPVSELAAKLKQVDGAHTVVFDGVITQRLVDIAGDKGIKLIIGDRISGVAKRPVEIQLLTFEDVRKEGH
jgi:DNA primase